MGILNWLAGNWIALMALIVSALVWTDSRRRYSKLEVDLQAELAPPLPGAYTIRNHGNRKLYIVQLDAERMAGHRIDEPIFAIALEPREPARFRVSTDENMEYPRGAVIQYKLRSWGRSKSQYVPLPLSRQVWNPGTGEWVDRER